MNRTSNNCAVRETFAPLCEVSSAKLAASLAISFMFTVSVAKRLKQMNHSGMSCQNLAYYEVCCTVEGEKKGCVRMSR